MTQSNTESTTRIYRKTLALAVSAALATQVQAQDQSGDEERGMLEEVIVTATKREESLMDIPVSVTAITGDSFVELGLQNTVDLEKVVPGMKVRYVGSRPIVILRGAGAAGTNDVAVPIYVDSLYRPLFQQGMASYIDLERVEVLRGPQGTLFGRNTFGGLINLITKKPDTGEFDYGGALTLGDYSLRRAEGFVNVPFTENLALRVSGSWVERDPYIENIYPPSGGRGGMRDEDATYGRAQLRWDATDNFDITFVYTDWQDDSNGSAQFATKVLGIPVNPDTNRTNGISGVLEPRQGTSATGPAGRSQAGQFPDDPWSGVFGPYEIATDYASNRSIEEQSFSALANWDIGFATLRANFGVFDFEERQLDDTDNSPNPSAYGERNPDETGQIGPGYWEQCWGGPACGLVAGTHWKRKAYQADINLNSNSDGKLRWTLGYYLFDNSDQQDNTYEFVWAYTDVDGTLSWAHWLYRANGGTKSTAIYGQAEYDFTDRLTVTAGLRSSTDKRNTFTDYIDYGPQIHGWNPDYYSDHLADPGSRFDPWPSYAEGLSTERINAKDTHTSYRLAAQYDLGESSMIYGFAANGFIAGSPVGGGSTRLSVPNEVDSYEIGYKATLLDGAMQLSVAYYNNDYEGLSTVRFVVQGQTITSQAVPGGSMDSQGLEVEMHWAATDNLNISAGLAMDRSEFKEFAEPESRFEEGGDIEVEGQRFYVLDGQDTRFSPDLTLGLDFSYVFDLAGGSTIVPGALIYYSDDYKTNNVPYFFAFQDSYTTLDLRATWFAADTPWSVQAFVTNATDEEVITETTVFSGNRAMADYNRPRQYGVRASYNF